jgi:uncharacterized membrane protein
MGAWWAHIFGRIKEMPPLLIVHIGAGCLGILSGYAAILATKGERLHRAFGTVFFLSMLTMAALAAYLALFMPPLYPGAAPASATVPVALLTFYLVATGWMTVRRTEQGVGLLDYGALLVVSCVAAAMLTFGLIAAGNPVDRMHGFPVRYYIFAAFATFPAMLDLKVILQGGISGAPRIARHLWRMCFALFFAASFFFLGQQRVVAYFHKSPLLFVPALAPLVVMVFWLFRVRATNWFQNKTVASVAS